MARLADGTSLTVKNNQIESLSFTEGKPVIIDFELMDSDNYLSMEAKAYGYKR